MIKSISMVFSLLCLFVGSIAVWFSTNNIFAGIFYLSLMCHVLPKYE